MKCPNGFEVPGYPTWMNTIRDHTRSFRQINDISPAAYMFGYPFILWDDRVYFLHRGPGSNIWESDTGWDIEDVGVNTAQSPELDRFINFGKDSW